MCVYPNHRAVFRFHQAVVVGVPRTRLVCSISSLFNNFSTVRLRNSLVVGMEAADTKGKLLDHGFQIQPGFTDRGCGAELATG